MKPRIKVEASEGIGAPPPGEIAQAAEWLMEALDIKPEEITIRITRDLNPHWADARTDGHSCIELSTSSWQGASLYFLLAHELGHVADQILGNKACSHPELDAISCLSAFGLAARSELCAVNAERLALPLLQQLMEEGAYDQSGHTAVENAVAWREEEFKSRALRLLDALEDALLSFELQLCGSPAALGMALASLASACVKRMLSRKIRVHDDRGGAMDRRDYRQSTLPARLCEAVSAVTARACARGATPTPEPGALCYADANWLPPVRVTHGGRATLAEETVRVLVPDMRGRVRDQRRWIQSLRPVEIDAVVRQSLRGRFVPMAGMAVQAVFHNQAADQNGSGDLSHRRGVISSVSSSGVVYVRFGRAARAMPVPVEILSQVRDKPGGS